MPRTIEDVNAQLERAVEQKQHFAEREKILRKQAAQLKAKNRTHRLCTHGGMLEKFLEEPEHLTDDQVMDILKLAFGNPDVKALLGRWLADIRALKAETDGEPVD